MCDASKLSLSACMPFGVCTYVAANHGLLVISYSCLDNYLQSLINPLCSEHAFLLCSEGREAEKIALATVRQHVAMDVISSIMLADDVSGRVASREARRCGGGQGRAGSARGGAAAAGACGRALDRRRRGREYLPWPDQAVVAARPRP